MILAITRPSRKPPRRPLRPEVRPLVHLLVERHSARSLHAEQLLHTAEAAMKRRNQSLTAEHVALYEYLHEATAKERQKAVQADERQTWRRSA